MSTVVVEPQVHVTYCHSWAEAWAWAQREVAWPGAARQRVCRDAERTYLWVVTAS